MSESSTDDQEIADVLRQLRGQKEISATALLQMDEMSIDDLVEQKETEEISALATAYFKGGEKIKQDKTKAAALWKAAADRGDINAEYSYAMSLQQGLEGQKPQLVAAVKILISLAERGHPW